MAVDAPLTRRDEQRARTLAEIKERALRQVADGGPEALSLNAIARAMRMSGPALYRYFDSRDELLAALVVESYDDLAATLEGAATRSGRSSGDLRVVATAFRRWALEHPHRYRLAFGSHAGSGLLAPERTVPAAHRSMRTFLAAVADAGGSLGPETSPELAAQLGEWARSRDEGTDVPPETLRRAVLAWTRLHGILSLELEGVFEAMGLDAGLLYQDEVDLLVTGKG